MIFKNLIFLDTLDRSDLVRIEFPSNLPQEFRKIVGYRPRNESQTLGKMDFNTYLIDEDFTLAVFSVAADSVLDLAGGNGPVIPIGSLEYFNKSYHIIPI